MYLLYDELYERLASQQFEDFPPNLCLFKRIKVVSATLSPACFISLNECTFETRKNVFYFSSKALFILEIIKF